MTSDLRLPEIAPRSLAACRVPTRDRSQPARCSATCRPSQVIDVGSATAITPGNEESCSWKADVATPHAKPGGKDPPVALVAGEPDTSTLADPVTLAAGVGEQPAAEPPAAARQDARSKRRVIPMVSFPKIVPHGCRALPPNGPINGWIRRLIRHPTVDRPTDEGWETARTRDAVEALEYHCQRLGGDAEDAARS